MWQGTRITTYAALNDAGIHAGAAGQGFAERLLERLPKRWLQRPFLLAVRNALRHKGRLARTMIVLILGTALFIGVISVRQSVDTTQADFLRYHQYDVRLQLEQSHRLARLESAALAVPGVVAVEGWGIGSATRLRPDGSESNRYQVYGLPEATRMVDPVLQAGRWLRPEDQNAVVINSTVADDERDIAVGDTIVLDMADREQPWTVVGIVGTDAQGPKLYMNYHTFGHANRSLGKVNSLQVVARAHDRASQDALEAALLNRFEAQGFDVRTTRTSQSLNKQNGLMFDTIIGFLIIMAGLLGGVGSLGLSTTMGINMLERIREIGVLRAIGASNRRDPAHRAAGRGRHRRGELAAGLPAVVPHRAVHERCHRRRPARYAAQLHLFLWRRHWLALSHGAAGGAGELGTGPGRSAADNSGGIGL